MAKTVIIPEINPFIIGAGGVASYLLPVLIRTFPIPRLFLRDADKLEEKNLDRQLFHPTQIGEYKARALLASLVSGANQGKIRTITETGDTHPETDANPIPMSGIAPNWVPECTWFSEGESPSAGTDLIICVADNHTARRAALHAAEQNRIPCIVAGNEYYDSNAMFVYPEDFLTPLNPFIRYPEILTDTTMNPIRCTGEALKSSPQLAVANLRCASHIMDLLWLHLVVLPSIPEKTRHETKGNFPYEIYTSQNNCHYGRYQDARS